MCWARDASRVGRGQAEDSSLARRENFITRGRRNPAAGPGGAAQGGGSMLPFIIWVAFGGEKITQASYGYPSRWWWSGGRVPRQQPNKPSEKGKEDFHCGGHGGEVPWAMFTQLPLSHPPSMFWVLLDVKF